MRVCVERLIQHEEKLSLSGVFASRPPKWCIFCTHKYRQCFKCSIVFPDRLAWSSILESLQFSVTRLLSYDLFAVVE